VTEGGDAMAIDPPATGLEMPSVHVAADEDDEGEDGDEGDEARKQPVATAQQQQRSKKSKYRPPIETLSSLFEAPAMWRSLGLFACEGAVTDPYMLMETYFRGASGVPDAQGQDKPRQRVAVVRVSASSALAQLVFSPLYEFRMRLEPDPVHAGFMRIADLDPESATFATAALGSARTGYRQRSTDAELAATPDPYLTLDDEYRSIVECIAATNEVTARKLRIPLTMRILETMFARCFVAGPGRTRLWYRTPQSRPVQMHIVRQCSEDPLGLWIGHKILWAHLEPQQRAAYMDRWVTPHSAVFEGAQILNRWGLTCERYRTGVAFERFCDALVLTRDAVDGTEFTALAMHDEQRKRQRTHAVAPPAPSIFLSHVIVALERAYASGSGTSILHARPGIVHLLKKKAHSDELPLYVAETIDEWRTLEALFDPANIARTLPDECKRMFKLLLRLPRHWFEGRQGVLAVTNPPGSDPAAERAFALELARLSIDHRAETTMERTLSTAHYVRLQSETSRLFVELTTWLYGRDRLSPNGVMLTPAAVVEYLVQHRPRLYAPAPNQPAGLLVRVASTEAMKLELHLASLVMELVRRAGETNEGLEIILMPLNVRNGVAYDAVSRLATLLARCTESNTVVVTPYALDRRARAITRLVIEQRGIHEHDHASTYAAIKRMLVSCGSFNLINLASSGGNDYNRHPITVIVDAAHLMSARQLLEIVTTFSGKNSVTRNLYIMGAPAVLPHFDRHDANRGAAFCDLVQTLPPASIQTGLAVDAHPISEADAVALTVRNDLEILHTAVTRWHLIVDRNEPVLQFSATRPSANPMGTYRTVMSYYSLLASAQTFLPRTSNPKTLVRSYAMHSHYTGAGEQDPWVVYEMDWDAFSKMTITEFITVLSHGYRVILYCTPHAPTNFPWTPTKNAEVLAGYLVEHFRKRLYTNTVSVARHTTWQAIGIHKLRAEQQQKKEGH
jgi:hypothetical protein